MTEPDARPWLSKQINDLYDCTHGLEFADMKPAALPNDEGERIALWAEHWRGEGFETAGPIGSSRLMEVALRQSTAGGSPRDLLWGLFEVLAADPPITPRLAFFIQHLCRAPLWEASLVDAYDFADGVPSPVTSAQALLLLRFAKDLSLYDQGAVERLSQQLDGEFTEELRQVFPEGERTDPHG